MATVTSKTSVQVPYYQYPNAVEKLLTEVFLQICMGKSCPLFLSNRCKLGFFWYVGWGFFFVLFCCFVGFFYVYGLNEQTGEFKYSLAKNPVRFIESVNFRDFFENLLS